MGVHTNTCNAALWNILKDKSAGVELTENIVQYTKAEKNETEQRGMRNCNIRDCAAIMKYFAFLEKELRKEDHKICEYEGARILDNLRTKGELH